VRLRHVGILMHIASVNSILDSRKRKAIQECYGLVTRIYKGIYGRLRLKCDGTRTETRFRLSAKRTSPFKSAGVSVQSTTGSRGVRISGSNAGYTKFRVSVKGTGYPLHSPVSPSVPLPLRHGLPLHFNWSLQLQIPVTGCSKA